MDRKKRYNCLVYMSENKPHGSVLIWSDKITPAQMAARQDIPVGNIYSTGQIIFNENRQKWTVINMDPLFNSGFRLKEDEELILKKIHQLEKAQTQQIALLKTTHGK